LISQGAKKTPCKIKDGNFKEKTKEKEKEKVRER